MQLKTDLEKFIELYKGFGIECKVNTDGDSKYIRLSEGGYAEKEDTISPLFEGYGGFYTKIIFDLDGKFVKQGFWE